MPIACEPGEPIRLVLPNDRGRSPEPAFYFRAMTVRDCRKLARLDARIERLDHASDPDEVDATIDELVASVKRYLGGWELWDAEGEPISYDPERIEDVLDLAELLMLLRLLQMGGMTGVDRKNCERPSPSPAESSAKPAAPADAN
jgi:hypothetical protein